MFLYTIIILILMIPILAIILDSRVGQALAARLERNGLTAGDDSVNAERIAFLESEVERLSGELQRLDEESRFMHELLTGKGTGADQGRLLGGDDSDESNHRGS